MKQQSINKKLVSAIIISASISALILASHYFGLLDALEYKMYDLRVNLFALDGYPSDDIVVVLLDQESIDWARAERGWGWPWPRKAYAEILDYMHIKEGEVNEDGEVLKGAKSFAFDVLFTEPSIYRNPRQDAIIDEAISTLEANSGVAVAGGTADPDSPDGSGEQGTAAVPARSNSRQPIQNRAFDFRKIVSTLQELSSHSDDRSFAEAQQQFGRAVQTVNFSTTIGNTLEWPADLDKPFFTLNNFDNILSQFGMLNQNSASEEIRAQFPIEDIRNTAGAMGNVAGWPDSDGIIRRANLFTYFDGKAVPGLSGASLLVSGEDRELSFDPSSHTIQWGAYTIPVDSEGRSILHYRGDLMERYFPYQAYRILQSKEAYEKGEESELTPEDFEGKYVFFGYYASGLFDIFANPLSSVYPGVGIHITMLDNILQQDFIVDSPEWADILLILGAIVLVCFLGIFSGKIPIVLAGTVVIIGFVNALGFAAYSMGNLWLPIVAPLAGGILAFLTTAMWNYATEGTQKRFIKSAFSRYLSEDVINQIIKDPSKLNLGGERREMTAIFTDIQRFSSISSELQDEYGADGPKHLVELLNQYLTAMSNIVLENHGTIDKFEGDAIIAFFGAPLDDPDHAIHACRAAVLMKKRELSFRDTIMKPDSSFYTAMDKLIKNKVIRSERPLYTRVGVNSGDMVVGNMGTPNKMDYTIMGNAVNLSARLEGVNKQYDTNGILISEYTQAKLDNSFVLRPLSRVTVVGIPTPVRLYELLDLKEEADKQLLEMAAQWKIAMEGYESKHFKEALTIFQSIVQMYPGDGAAKLYAKRCTQYMEKLPSENWDGIDNLTEK
ncbi:CHASE2 domain-containing protein [Breznakiellaceae bacterium SP9]